MRPATLYNHTNANQKSAICYVIKDSDSWKNQGFRALGGAEQQEQCLAGLKLLDS